MTNISYQPTEGLTYDPEDERYWSLPALDQEVRRAFEICHGCRMCFKYCDSFPNLFKLLDERYDGDVRALDDGDVAQVMDACFQCKLCEVQCPYTPRDGHEFQLDFPKLVHRYHANRRLREPAELRDEVLADPDGTGQLARLSFGMANAMNKVPLHRALMEKVLGIHRDKLLPDFASQTFEAWAEKSGRIQQDPPAEAVLFQTCYVQNNEPQIGKDVLEVLDKNQVKTACVRGLQCCGMPAWEHGDLATLRERAKVNLDILHPHVKAGAKVLVVNPTCSMMLRREYPELVPERDRAKARAVAAAVQDPGEYLWSIRNEPRFNTDFKSTPGAAVAYHAPCHLRAQAVGFRGRDLLRKIPGVQPKPVMECCGHDGTYAMKVESFEASKRVGKKAFEQMKGHDAEVWATECPLAAVQFEQHAGRRALHPMTVLARAYRADGFPQRLGDEEE
jgi:glycerol-3-phosphate dehydrogenase subunit C